MCRNLVGCLISLPGNIFKKGNSGRNIKIERPEKEERRFNMSGIRAKYNEEFKKNAVKSPILVEYFTSVPINILNQKANAELIQSMLRHCKVNLDNLLATSPKNLTYRKVIYLLMDELAAIVQPEIFTIRELFLHLLMLDFRHLQYHTWVHWTINPRMMFVYQATNMGTAPYML